jgi:hypothetical protein
VRFYSWVRSGGDATADVTRFSRSLQRVALGYRGMARLVPVPFGPGFFLYTLQRIHIALAHMYAYILGHVGPLGPSL